MSYAARWGWKRVPLFALAALASACTVDAVDFSGKSCAKAGDCPEGYRCDLTAKACAKVGDAGADAGPAVKRDAQVMPPDAEVISDMDAEVVEPPDAAVEPSDAATSDLDGSVADLDASQTGTDAATIGDGGTCTDPQCKTLGAFFCAPDGSCQPCTTDRYCGSNCIACNIGQYCDGAGCAACNVPGHCGWTCQICSGTTPLCAAIACVECLIRNDCKAPKPVCDLGTNKCVECTGDPDCPLALPKCQGNKCYQCLVTADCAAGSWCNNNACTPCNDLNHCGPTCLPCPGTANQCDGTKCLECVTDNDCVGATGGPFCCQNTCQPALLHPTLSSLWPIVAPKGVNTTITLYGTNFGACSQVLVNGAPVASTFMSSTKLQAVVPGTTLPLAPYPVAVVNPGPTGGASNPNAFKLGADLAFTSSPVGVVYVPATDLVVVALNVTTNSLVLFNPETWTSSGTLTMAYRPTGIGAGTATVVVGLNSNRQAVVYPGLPNTASTTLPANALYETPLIIDVDEAGGQVLFFSNQNDYQTMRLPSLAVNPRVLLNGSGPCCQPTGAGIDGAFDPFLALDNGAGFAPPSAPFVQVSSQARYGVALDRTRHQVWLPGTTTVRAYDFATHAPGTSVPVGSGNMGIIGVNPAVNGALVVLFPDSGNSAAQLIDMSPPAPAVAGSFGPAVSRYCGGGGGPGKSGDDVAVDPSHNRAFYLNSCSRMLEGYNLNVVFVK